MDTFAEEWTFRDPVTTITYPAGHSENLPEHIRAAAQNANALAQPALEADNGDDDISATPSPPRRTRSTKSE